MTWGWVNYQEMFIWKWTNPLIALFCSSLMNSYQRIFYTEVKHVHGICLQFGHKVLVLWVLRLAVGQDLHALCGFNTKANFELYNKTKSAHSLTLVRIHTYESQPNRTFQLIQSTNQLKDRCMKRWNFCIVLIDFIYIICCSFVLFKPVKPDIWNYSQKNIFFNGTIY